MYYFLDINDIIFTPLYFIIAVCIILIIRRNLSTPILKNYFLWGAVTKMFFSILFGIVYEFYYKGGDTSAYYVYGKIVGSALWESPIAWVKLLMAYPISDPDIYEYTRKIIWYGIPNAYFPCRIVGFLSPFCVGTYSVIAILFALIVFSGQWAMFTVFYKLYPKLHRQLAISVFFAPSICSYFNTQL